MRLHALARACAQLMLALRESACSIFYTGELACVYLRSLAFAFVCEYCQESHGPSRGERSFQLADFALHKGAFHDALALRYDWQPSRCPSNCACGTKFTVDHALSCPKGGFPSIRHNEIRDLTANLLTEICHDVCIEPDLQPITGEVLTCATSNTQDGARLDIAANGFWGGRFERAYFDVRVFNPHAPSNRQTRMPACYRKHESVKKRAYMYFVLPSSASGVLAPVVAMHSRRHPPLTWSTLNRDCHCQCNLSTFYIISFISVPSFFILPATLPLYICVILLV